MIFELAHEIGLIPLLWLTWLHFRGKDLDVAWWWIAGAFFVSWLADTAAHFVNPWLASPVYLVSQSALVGAVFLNRYDAIKLVIVLAVVGTAAVLWQGVHGPDVLLHTVAWLSVVGIIYPLRQLTRLRTALLVAFGFGWLTWMGYAIWPGWTSWSVYQLTRLAGILLFCWAATSPHPHFVVSADDASPRRRPPKARRQ